MARRITHRGREAHQPFADFAGAPVQLIVSGRYGAGLPNIEPTIKKLAYRS